MNQQLAIAKKSISLMTHLNFQYFSLAVHDFPFCNSNQWQNEQQSKQRKAEEKKSYRKQLDTY